MSNNELISIDEQALANIMNKRHKLARIQSKNLPQPKFCISAKTVDGQECFINVLSYSRIANKLSEFDPIPLYGGMQIRSFRSLKNPLQLHQPEPTNPQLIFAVMASPEVLKHSGRNQMDNPEQLSLVELMCEFVEAMNPGIVLSKNPEVLRDRDLSGELKDVWSAVQNFRDRERAAVSDIVVYTEFGPESTTSVDVKSPEHLEPKHNDIEKNESSVDDDENDNEATTKDEESNVAQETSDNLQNSTTKINSSSSVVESLTPSDDTQKLEIEKLSISKVTSTKQNENNHHNNESSEKIVKIQNQKNKESFLPKFLTSNKDKDKDKEKEKDETEQKVKTKKSLIFFRRSKSTTSSPTHSDKNEDDN